MTEQQALLVAEETYKGQMQYPRVLAVLKTHARLHQFFDIPQFTLALRADNDKAKVMRRRSDEEKIVQFIRRKDPLGTMDKPDAVVIQEHFSMARWNVDRSDADHDAKQKIRGLIAAHARQALTEVGFEFADADVMAREWAGVPARDLDSLEVLK